jgi:hypothetical protein
MPTRLALHVVGYWHCLTLWELAEQMGHAPAMTIGTYTHVIRELKGEPIVSAEEQIQRARDERPGRSGDADAAGAGA